MAIAILALAATAMAAAQPLRVCADPNNLPFSNMKQQGFENKLAEMVGRELHRPIQYVWWPQRARFVEKRLKANTCDLVMAIPSRYSLLAPTKPYYRSTYVFVMRRKNEVKLASLADARLKKMRIGLHVIGDDDSAVPAADELAQRGMVGNMVGFSIYGHPFDPNPSAELLDAVADGKVDVAIAWGPMASYFARKATVPLAVQPICPSHDKFASPTEFSISMGVRKDDPALKRQLNRLIDTRSSEIHRILRSYGVPMVSAGAVCH